MARGPKKHMKRLKAPKHWMLDKLTGIFAPRPSTGPHKMRESLPLMILLRNRLKYALTKRECQTILMNRLIKVRPLASSDSCGQAAGATAGLHRRRAAAPAAASGSGGPGAAPGAVGARRAVVHRSCARARGAWRALVADRVCCFAG